MPPQVRSRDLQRVLRSSQHQLEAQVNIQRVKQSSKIKSSWGFLASLHAHIFYSNKVNNRLQNIMFSFIIYYYINLLKSSRAPLLPCSPSPPSRQSNFLILNISAISSWIFTKFWGKLPLGTLQWLKQKTNEYINKQTNKQTNKHFPV